MTKWIRERLEENERKKRRRLKEARKAYTKWWLNDRKTYPIAGFNGLTAAQIFGEAT